MRVDMSLPWWAWALMGVGLALFAAMVVLSVRRNHGVKRSLFAAPYSLWMILFTIVPVVLIAYYAFTDASGAFTLDNFRHFFDSNYSKNQLYASLGPEAASFITRGTVNVDTLVYSLWMAFLCTAICLLMGYPAALFMADRHMKLGPSLVVLFIIPMWMNFLLRTYAWMSLLEKNGIINRILGLVGLGPFEMINTSGAVVLGMVYNYLPYMILPLYTAMTKIDQSVVEAAQDLGAGMGKILTRVLIPLSVPGIATGITMVFVPAVSTFIISRMLGGGSNLLIGDLIELQFLGNSYNYNLGSAMSLVLMVIVLLCMSFTSSFDEEDMEGVV